MTSATTERDSLSPEERLAKLGIDLPPAPQPVAIYVPAVRSGHLIYSSGQLPLVDGTIKHPGKVGADVTLEQAHEAARLCALNALAAIRPLVGDLGAIKRVVKVVGFVAGTADFTSQPSVVNGASQLLGEVFGAGIGEHARSAVGVAALPLDAPVEVEIVVEV